MDKPIIVGFLGGIGSGKSTAARIMRSLGADCVCADKMALALLEKERYKKAIIEEFGREILDGKGKIDKKKLAAMAFSTERNLKKLNSILHPPVVSGIVQRIGRTPPGRVFVIDAPLLFETGMQALCDFLFFIESKKNRRLARIANERGWSKDDIQRRQRFQMPLRRKRKVADLVISNDGDLKTFEKQVKEIYESIRKKMKRGRNRILLSLDKTGGVENGKGR